MSYKRFEEFKTDFQRLYQNQDFEAAYELASQFVESFPERWPLITYWRISSAARAGHLDLALGVLEEFLDSGFWFGDILLRNNPALKPLQELPAFESLIQRNQDARIVDQSTLFPILMVRPQGKCKGEGNICPLLVGLHTNASTARDSLDFWSPAGTAGWLVAAPQSSQAIWKDAYVWDDLAFARHEVENHISSLNQRYAVDPKRIFLAGHDIGAETALWLALNSPSKYSGFILLGINGPLTENPDNWQQLLAAIKEREKQEIKKLRGYFVLGKKDRVSPRENIPPLMEILELAGIHCKFEEIEGVGHGYAAQYDSALLRGLDYVSGFLQG